MMTKSILMAMATLCCATLLFGCPVDEKDLYKTAYHDAFVDQDSDGVCDVCGFEDLNADGVCDNYVAYSDDDAHLYRRIPAGQSEGRRPAVPSEAGQ